MKRIASAVLIAMVLLLYGPLWVQAGGKHVRTSVHIGIGHPGRWGHHHPWHHHRHGSHSHWRTTVVLGPWYPYGYCAHRPVIVYQEPSVYVQQEQEESYWYYCREPEGYYPYVQSCPGGWMKVVPDTTPPQ